ncbi:plasmid segregation centromere-binding protein ParR [Faecalicatena orotica]|uniref:plasmid segregation centromere-binding protein ParR n=1 Tax=Clostridium sp. AF19-22AC TaxID=2292204 RepID=UPI00269FB150
MGEVKRPVFSFRPNMDIAEHRQAWELLSHVPEGQKNQYLVQAILRVQERGYLEKVIRKTVREELKSGGMTCPEVPVADTIPDQMLDFLSKLDDSI